MGTWDVGPWDNDNAADWFARLWDGTPIVERIQSGLKSGQSTEVIAAAWLCSELCRVYVWPITSLDETLGLATAATARILAGEDESRYLASWDDDRAARAQIQELHETLLARIG